MYNGNMQILIYENVNYTKVGSMQSISLAPIGATLELNGKAYRIIDYIILEQCTTLYMVVKPISKHEYSAYEGLKNRGVI
jgi:hypothetical protein